MNIMNLEMYAQKHYKKIIRITALIVIVLYGVFFLCGYGLRQDQISRGGNPAMTLPILGSDSLEYATLARNLVDHHTFSVQSTDPYAPDTFRTIGYPLFVAFFLALGLPLAAVPLIQIILALLTGYGIYLIGNSLFKSRLIGGIAGLVYVLDPVTIINSLTIVTDTLYVFLLVYAIYFLFCSHRNEWERATLAGLLLGFSTLVRPISMFLLAIFIVLLAAKLWNKKESWKKVACCIGILCLFYSIIVLPWVVRNKEMMGVYGISTVKSFNLYHYYIPEFLAYKHGISPSDARKIVGKGLWKFDERSLVNATLMQERGLEFIKEDPFGYGKFHIVKTLPFFLSSGFETLFTGYNDASGKDTLPIVRENMTNLLLHRDFAGMFWAASQSPLIAIEQILLGMLFILAIGAIIFAYRRRQLSVISFLWMMVLYFAFLTGPVAYSRYRQPATPFLFLLATYAIVIRSQKPYETSHNDPKTR